MSSPAMVGVSQRHGPLRCRFFTRRVQCLFDNPRRMKTELSINGETRAVEADPDTPLLWVLRDHLGMTGTKFGCGIGQCGACTVHFDGTATRSCLVPLKAAVGAKITTIEGLSPDSGHPLQRAWLDINVAQCGYCQAGMLMAAAALLRDTRRIPAMNRSTPR